MSYSDRPCLCQPNYPKMRSPFIKGVTYATSWQVGRYPTPIMTAFNNQFLSALLGDQSLQVALERAQKNANSQIWAYQ